MTKLIIAFRDFSNVPKNEKWLVSDSNLQTEGRTSYP
jgi:hypothetical protein